MKSPFTATKTQVAAYLLGVALFSISFLVFLNSAVSFVVTDLIGQKHGVGDAVGTLGFVDELVALVACPLWGLVSDRLGVKWVCFLGYAIIGISLFVFVQARNVYPQLLIARMLFSIGGAATSTMVTAILPTMIWKPKTPITQPTTDGIRNITGHTYRPSLDSETTMTPGRYQDPDGSSASQQSATPSRSASSQTAGLVGMFTGVGALVALLVFLPLPARFQAGGQSPGAAVAHSFYVVGAVALVIAGLSFVGLRNLKGEEDKGWRALFRSAKSLNQTSSRRDVVSYWRAFVESSLLGFQEVAIGLGYLGGFVARASSVGISLFIPLYVNAYFIASGLCDDNPASDPSEIKRQCRRAYAVAAGLSGASQLVALICAPIFGYLDGRFRRFNIPLLVAAACGVIGYVVFPRMKSPDPGSKDGTPAVFAVMALLGISQIGAIVCSLSMLGRGIQGGKEGEASPPPSRPGETQDYETDDTPEESSRLLPSHLQRLGPPSTPHAHLKGSIAGLYSLCGGAGILILTKLGGYLFDKTSFGAPFYMLAVFNAILLVVGIACTIGIEVRRERHKIAL